MSTDNIEQLRSEYAFDITLSELELDPHPILAKLRQDRPLVWLPSLGMWLATRKADVEMICTSPELYSAQTEPSFLRDVLGENMLTLEGETAKRLKTGMISPFTLRGCGRDFVANELQDVADNLIASFKQQGGGDIMSLFAAPLSTESLKIVLGLRDIDTDKMWDLCCGICVGIANFEGDPALDKIYLAATAELEVILRDKIEAVRSTPDHSAISYFVRHENGFSDTEIINNVRLMISGGINEPRDGIGLATLAFLQFAEPGTKEPNSWPVFINEVLRYYAPVGTAARMTTQPTKLCGVDLPAGEFVAACLSSANRDESFWEDADSFLPGRKQRDHIAFSRGQHRCLGLWLGLKEIQTGVSSLLAQLDGLRFDPDHEVVMHGFEFRGPKTLYLKWDT